MRPVKLAKEGRRENPASAILQVFDVVGRENEQIDYGARRAGGEEEGACARLRPVSLRLQHAHFERGSINCLIVAQSAAAFVTGLHSSNANLHSARPAPREVFGQRAARSGFVEPLSGGGVAGDGLP